MKRPSDQAKLLFFYLLRSSAAALATTSNDAGHICLRLARRTDVPALQRCNLATLPENYNAEFYSQHLRTWPDLALVAEHILPGQQQNAQRSFPGSQPEPNIVGYVLGKVEDRYIPYDPKTESRLDGTVKTFKDLAGNTLKLEPTGHVTSLAVLHDFRRRGLAASLMNQLHAHLEQSHGVSQVGLHVRQGNEAATKLYESYGYHVDEVLDHYYADGEPAFLMRKSLKPVPTGEKNRLRIGRATTMQWQGKGPFDLPRVIWRPEKEAATVAEATVPVEVMTGS
jgi:ribosomal protein S18 acetylase RimI-like enzyme